MRVEVSDKLCAGHALCLSIAPTVFDMDADDDVAHVLVPNPSPEQEADVLKAARSCPTHAIIVSQ